MAAEPERRTATLRLNADTVRMRLLRLVLLLLLPALLLAGMVTWRSYRTVYSEAQSDLRNAAATLGRILDVELGNREVRLRLLAATDQLARHDIAAFADLATVASRFGARIVLSDAANQWLVDTRGAAGQASHVTIPWEAPGGAPRLHWAGGPAGAALMMTVPVGLDGRHAYNLTAFVPVAAVQAALMQLRLPEGWVATLYDTDLHIVARSAQLDQFRGQQAGGDVRDALRDGDTQVEEGQSAQSGQVMFIAGRSPRYGLRLTLEAPDELAGPSLVSLLLLVGAGIIMVLLGMMGALQTARSITGPIEALAKAARTLGEQTDLPPIPRGLAEVDAVAQAMTAANAALIERSAALSDMNATLAARVASRTAELAQANAALEEQRARLGLILDHIPVGVLVSQSDGVVLFTNAEVRRLLAIGDGPLDRRSMPLVRRGGERIPLEDAPSARARRGVTTPREVLTIERRDGAVLELEVSAGPVLDRDGQVALSVTVMQDVTDRLAAEEARRRSQRLEAVGQLTGGVAHEFNNLLMAIGGCLDLLAPHVEGDRARVLLENAVRAGDRGARLTRQLLAFARRQHLQPAPVDLNALVSGMTELLAGTLGRGINVVTALGPDTWAAMADTTQLELVLLNLAINARDAMPGGGRLVIGTANATRGKPRRPESPPAGEYAVLSVTDTGTGMTPEVQSRIFEPFFTTKDVGLGSGLGLPQVLGVAQELGGGVTVASAPGRGTTVSVFLPRAHAAPDPVRRAAPQAPAPAELRGLRVLLVDDDASVREVARSMLEEMGACVLEAESGPDALLLLRTGTEASVVLADFTMPRMNGVELAAQIAELLPGLPIVLMTGYSAAALGELGPAIRSVLQKPFRAQGMADAVLAAREGRASF